MRLIVSSNRGVALRNVKVATSYWAKLKGLMLVRELQHEDGLLIEGCRSVHCCFMRIPIDVVFLSKEGRIEHIIHSMAPWTFSRYVRSAQDVLECMAGTAARHGWQIGEFLHLQRQGNS